MVNTYAQILHPYRFRGAGAAEEKIDRLNVSHAVFRLRVDTEREYKTGWPALELLRRLARNLSGSNRREANRTRLVESSAIYAGESERFC